MEIEHIKEKLKTYEYDFLRQDKSLGSNMILLTLGGSHAYGISIKISLSYPSCTALSMYNLTSLSSYG